jgi:hypothetical protein
VSRKITLTATLRASNDLAEGTPERPFAFISFRWKKGLSASINHCHGYGVGNFERSGVDSDGSVAMVCIRLSRPPARTTRRSAAVREYRITHFSQEGGGHQRPCSSASRPWPPSSTKEREDEAEDRRMSFPRGGMWYVNLNSIFHKVLRWRALACVGVRCAVEPAPTSHRGRAPPASPCGLRMGC